jgi:lipopolysaccharide transport system permease protein
VHAFDVVAVLVSRDLKVLYKRSTLGFGWALITPLLQVCIFVLVFRNVLGAPVQNYASFVFTGVLVWGWFQSSLQQGTTLITSNRALARQPGFPLALLPIVTVAVRLFHFSLALPILFGLLWFQGIRPADSWAFLPLLAVIQFALLAGFAYPLAALNVRLRDTQHVVAVLLQLAIYVSPVFYSLEVIPSRLAQWLHLNPMVPMLAAWRDVLLHGRAPNPVDVILLAIFSGSLLLFGRRIFAAESRRFVEEL